MNCADCSERKCLQGEDCVGLRNAARDRYRAGEPDMKISRVATFIEGTYYMKYTRLQKSIEFCRMMGYGHLGIAFCIGLSGEAETLQSIFEAKGFKVTSVCCKVCGIAKEEFDLRKMSDERLEVMCNPVGQALVQNSEKVDINVGVGLCVGHDILFAQHSNAPFTTLVVKDRVLAHNPLGAIYSRYHLNRLRSAEHAQKTR